MAIEDTLMSSGIRYKAMRRRLTVTSLRIALLLYALAIAGTGAVVVLSSFTGIAWERGSWGRLPRTSIVLRPSLFTYDYSSRAGRASSRHVDHLDFRWHDYRTGQTQPMTLDADEFIRRFLLHVLPDGFVRIRHYGLFANCHRAKNLNHCRQLLHIPPAPPSETPSSSGDLQRCPRCHKGQLVLIQLIPATHHRETSQAGRAPP